MTSPLGQLPGATRSHQLHEPVGPAVLPALRLARYQALRNIGKDIVEIDENDVLNQKPSHEEERIVASNASVVSALEDIFSWIYKDRSSRTSRLSSIESWRFHRAMYRVWIVSTLYGYGSAVHGQYAKGASRETQEAFLSKFTSQELVQVCKVSRFLRWLGFWAIHAERKYIGSLDVYDFDGLYLFAGPHIMLRCFEEQSPGPLPTGYLFDEEIYAEFLLPAARGILSQRNVDEPYGFVGSVLDEVCGVNYTCRACGRNGDELSIVPGGSAPRLYSETNWGYLKGDMETPFEIFLKLACNQVERPLFELLDATNYDTLFHELFAHKGEPFQDWTKQDWICAYCIQDFFTQTVFRWWSKHRMHATRSSLPDCRHGLYCKDQCFEKGRDHANRFNHACMPVDEIASLAHYHGR